MKPGSQLEPVGGMIANRYRVEQTLGRGGMAVVYKVRDQRGGAQLALKRCMARDPRRRQRYEALLEREYHTLVQLAHPRIIAVYDYGVDRSGPYYTMELLDGADLERDERTPWREVCALLCDVASSLAIMHSRGLIHRDVSTRNVRYTSDRRAKLIDFGAMMSIGVATDAVGTPPFMAPEVLQLQQLDGRVDLFALGALGYRLLTGRHAFPAKRLRDLRDIWRSRPPAPVSLVPEVPLELSTLLLQMLSLDRAARPQNAAEVMERLRTAANLSLDESPEISRAYLTTPVLVGRDAALLGVRKRMLALVRGDGGLLLIQGEHGAGRSRMLDACALEAKLLGATVVRADARDARNGDWGVARNLAAQLLEQLPERASDAARLSRNVLGYVLDELRTDDVHTATGYAPERSILIRELRDWMLSLSKSQRLCVVVDDADRIDDASFVLLAALAHKAERNALLLALAIERESTPGPTSAMPLLREFADVIELEDIQPQETEALMRSLFGDVANLPLCAAMIHGLSHGNPRTTMELAQHLVDTGRARYGAGSWVLPADLDETSLPHTLAASLSARLAGLSSDARELADALTLADADALHAVTYPQLTDHRQVKRVFHALDELVAARVLSAGADRYAFTQRGLLSVLQDSMSDARRQQIHLRIARLLASSGGDVLRRAHHLLAGGMDRDAIDMLTRIDLTAEAPPVSLLMAAIERGERLGLPINLLHRLRMAVLINAPFGMEHESFRRVVPLVLQQLEHDSGLLRYRELAQLPENERLNSALSLTQQNYQNTPEHERVHSTFEAMRELSRLTGSITSMATVTFDYELLESLPDMRPLFPLSPTLPVIAQVVEGSRLWLQGRLTQARTVYLAILTRIAEPDRAGFDDAQHERLRLGLEFTCGLLEAVSGNDNAEARARRIEGKSELRVNAWRIRALFALACGNTSEWRKCSRRSQLLQAQEGMRGRYVESTLGMELALHMRLGDLVAVKGLRDGVAGLAARHNGWRSVEMYGRAAYCELQGDLEGALEVITAALALAPPQRLPFFGSLCTAQIRVLLLLERKSEAAQLARSYLKTCTEQSINAADIYRYGALALAATGDPQAGLFILSQALQRVEAISQGFALGAFYDTRARLAIELGDRDGFEHFAERCRVEYEKSKNPDVMAKLVQLFDLARVHGLCPEEAVIAIQNSIGPPADESEYETIQSRIAECVDAADRGRCALTLLLQNTASTLGYLYTVDAAQSLQLLAALPDPPNDRGLHAWLERYVTGWLAPSYMDEVTGAGGPATTQSTDTGSSEPQCYLDPDGRSLQALPLVGEQPEGRKLAGVLVLQVRGHELVGLARSLTAAVADELLEYGDASGHPSPY